MLIIIYGNIGTGKSTLGKILSEDKGYKLIRFDEIMWMFKDKIYTQNDTFLLKKEEILKIYDDMHKLAIKMLIKGKNVILESLYLNKQREQAKKIAKQTKNKCVLIELICNEKEIKKRLKKRKKEDSQTPGFKLYLKYKRLLRREPNCIIIDTSSKNIEDCYKELIKKLKKVK